MKSSGILICSPCATGACSDCRGQVASGRVTKRCACRHGAAGASVVARSSDPRGAGGSLIPAGPGEGETLIDTSRAVLLEEVTVARVDQPSGAPPVLAALLEGRINRSADSASILYLMGGALAASIVAELLGLAARMGPDFEAEFRASLDQSLELAELWPSVAPAGGS